MCVAFYAILLSCLLSTACKMIKRERERERCKSSAVTVATHQKPNTRCQWSFRSSRGAAQRITCICSKHTHAQPSTETVTLSYTHTDYNLPTHAYSETNTCCHTHTHTSARMHICIERDVTQKTLPHLGYVHESTRVCMSACVFALLLPHLRLLHLLLLLFVETLKNHAGVNPRNLNLNCICIVKIAIKAKEMQEKKIKRKALEMHFYLPFLPCFAWLHVCI